MKKRDRPADSATHDAPHVGATTLGPALDLGVATPWHPKNPWKNCISGIPGFMRKSEIFGLPFFVSRTPELFSASQSCNHPIMARGSSTFPRGLWSTFSARDTWAMSRRPILGAIQLSNRNRILANPHLPKQNPQLIFIYTHIHIHILVVYLLSCFSIYLSIFLSCFFSVFLFSFFSVYSFYLVVLMYVFNFLMLDLSIYPFIHSFIHACIHSFIHNLSLPVSCSSIVSQS